MMMDCWKAEPTERPSFTTLVNKMDSLLEEAALTLDVRDMWT